VNTNSGVDTHNRPSIHLEQKYELYSKKKWVGKKASQKASSNESIREISKKIKIIEKLRQKSRGSF
jgi:hypothetical protein